MLELRPNCERCDTDLPPQSAEAVICTYECTFCLTCARTLRDVCPNCGGNFAPRPIRPRNEWRKGTSLTCQRPSDVRVHMSRTESEAQELSERLASLPPADR